MRKALSAPYPELPRSALILPIPRPGGAAAAAVMVAGLSARLRVDDAYRSFCDLMACAVGAVLANAQAYEDERRKVEALAEIDRTKTVFFST